MATTAISYRRGDTEENNAFAGVDGEIVADLGNGGTVDDGKATIILHRGDGHAGGIRMARQDFQNITQESITNLATFEAGEGSIVTGLMYNDLHNIKHNNTFRGQTEEILKFDYSIASKDAHDVSTYLLTNTSTIITDQAPGGGPWLATNGLNNLTSEGINRIRTTSFDWWKSEVDTEYLAENARQPGSSTGHKGKDLAYADMSNVNTVNLATSGAGHSGDNLAYANLTNVEYQTIVNHIDKAYTIGGQKLQKYEWTDNKISIIDPYVGEQLVEYPNTRAVIDYTKTLSENYANTRLDNIISWKIASETSNKYKINITIDNGGSGYSTSGSTSLITTNISHPDGGFVQIKILKVDNAGKILEASVENDKLYCSTLIPTTAYIDTANPGAAEFVISTVGVVAGKLMCADLSNSEIQNISGTNVGKISYSTEEDTNNNIIGVNSVFGQLMDTTTDTAGSFSVEKTTTGVETKIAASDSSKLSSITVVKNNAYLNKNEDDEILDANHELLNRNEIVTFVDTEIQEAIEAAISTAVVFKGVVANQTLLPTSGQTNGDLYWITEYVEPTPSGIIAGRSGSAIWNANVTPATWAFTQDNQNVPDGTTIKYTTTASAQKLSVRIAGAQTEGANALVVKTDGLYVKTPVEVPSLPTLPNDGDTGVYHLYAQNINGTMTYSWVNDALMAVTGTSA